MYIRPVSQGKWSPWQSCTSPTFLSQPKENIYVWYERAEKRGRIWSSSFPGPSKWHWDSRWSSCGVWWGHVPAGQARRGVSRPSSRATLINQLFSLLWRRELRKDMNSKWWGGASQWQVGKNSNVHLVENRSFSRTSQVSLPWIWVRTVTSYITNKGNK